jgi:two-component system, response regulator
MGVGSKRTPSRSEMKTTFNSHHAAAKNLHQPGPILLIDDDPDELFLSQRMLLKAGLNGPIVTATSGQEAIQLLRNSCPASGAKRGQKPVIVFVDINMPDVDGFGVLRWVRRKTAYRKTRVIMLSNSNHSADRDRALELGADAYIVKQADVSALAATVQDVVRRLGQS